MTEPLTDHNAQQEDVRNPEDERLEEGEPPSKQNKFRCRVDGCKRHLSREKTYFRRYRCCMSHSKQPAVVVDGQIRRWCQQCCCFHDLAAFDGEKRNCRERLAMHNHRRNKRKNDPQGMREPSSRVAQSTSPNGGGGRQPNVLRSGRVSRTPTSLQSALSGGAEGTAPYSSGGHSEFDGGLYGSEPLQHYASAPTAKRHRQTSPPVDEATAMHQAILAMMIGSGQAPSSYTDALAAAAVAQQAIAGQQPGSLTAAQLLAAKQMQLQPPLNSFMPQGSAQVHSQGSAMAAFASQLQAAGMVGGAGGTFVGAGNPAAAGMSTGLTVGSAPGLQQWAPMLLQQQQQASAASLQQQGLYPQHNSAPPMFNHLLAAGQELSLGYNSKDRQTSGQPDLVEVRSLSDTQAAAPASLSAQASWPAAPVARRPGPAGRTPGHSAAVLQQAPPAAWPPIGGPAAANSGAANPLRQQLLQAMAATQGRAPLALAPAGIPVPGGIPQQPQHIVGRPHGLAAVKTEAMKTEPVKAAKAQARQKQPAGSLIVAGVAEDPDWAAIVGAAFLARRLRKSLQAVRWKPAAPPGSPRWWQRRLGALLLLVRLGASAATPAEVFGGVLALSEVALRLTRSAGPAAV